MSAAPVASAPTASASAPERERHAHLAEPGAAEPSWASAVEAPAPQHAFVTDENPFALPLPPRPTQPQTRAEAKAAAADRASQRARNTAAAKAEIRAKYPIPSASPDRAAEVPAAFRTVDTPPSARKLDVPLIVSISLGAAGVILIVYLAVLVFGARG